MKSNPTKLTLTATLLLSALSLQPSSLLAQGSLTPPGVPAPTMKTLTQIEPRTPIGAAPFIISVPGSYYLTTNLTVSSGNAITITTNGVTLDLNGFTLASTAPAAVSSEYGIYVSGGRRNLAILNGFIQGGVTNNGIGVFNGSGFGYGLYCPSVQNARVVGLSVSGCLYSGIYLGTGDATVVETCTVRTVGSIGIAASTVKASVANDCGSHAVFGDQVSDSRGESIGGYGVLAVSAQNCYGASSSLSGLYASATAQNCYGASSTGSGLFAYIAQDCYGTSSSSYGLYANTAQNCFGTSGSGYGLYASSNANNCNGYSSSGTALYAGTASFCTGSRSGGTAIQAIVATGCRAAAGTNNITYKYNMP